jgi:DNA polymerase-3 subunit chi
VGSPDRIVVQLIAHCLPPLRLSVTILFMPDLRLHRLRSPKRAGELAALLGRLYGEGQRIVVWVEDEGRRQILDDYLWSFEKLSFLPHLLWGPELGEVEDPIVLVGEPANPNRAATLVVGDGLPPGGWAAAFDSVHDFIPPGDEGADREEFWTRWSADPSTTEAE